MKKIIYLLLCLSAQANAQSANQVLGSSLSHYVFQQFLPGKVYLHTGEVSDRTLNYNALTREMIFEDNGQPMAIANPEKVDSVVIAGHKFIPADNKFYEWVAGTAYPVYADYVCTVEEQGASSGYGTASSTAASNTMKTLHGNGTVYAMRLPDEYKVHTRVVYHLRQEKEYNKFSSAQQLGKLLPAKKKWIGDYIKNNPTDFSKREEVVRLIQALETAGNDRP